MRRSTRFSAKAPPTDNRNASPEVKDRETSKSLRALARSTSLAQATTSATLAATAIDPAANQITKSLRAPTRSTSSGAASSLAQATTSATLAATAIDPAANQITTPPHAGSPSAASLFFARFAEPIDGIRTLPVDSFTEEASEESPYLDFSDNDEETELRDSEIFPSSPCPSPLFPVAPAARTRIPKTSKTKPKSSTSPYLRFFVASSDPDRLRCTLCPATPPTLVRYIFNERKTSSSLKNHMNRHPIEKATLLDSGIRYAQARRHLIRAIAVGALPFTVSNSHEIREFARCLDPSFIMPDRTTLSTSVLDHEFDMSYRTVFQAVTMQDVALTFDHWSSKDSNHSLMGATAHTIDSDWNRHFFVVSLDNVDGSHTGNQVKEYLHNLQREFHFKTITTCVTDNASVMTSGVTRSNLPRIGCVLHSCHLFVVNSLEGFVQGRELINAVRRVAVHLHRSKNSWDKVKNTLIGSGCRDTRKMPLEVRTRWGSTMRMLRIADNQVDCLADAFHLANVSPLRFEQRQLLSRLVAFLVEVDDFCLKMSSHSSTLSSLIPYLRGLEITIDELRETALHDYHPFVQEQFTKRLAKYREIPIVRYSYLLDPR